MAERIGAGFAYVAYGFNDTDGYFLGGTTTAPTAGDQTGSPLTRLTGGRVMPVSIPEPELVPADGDDQTYVQFQFDPADLPSGILETVQRNDAFEADAQGTAVDVDGNIRIGALDPRDRATQSICFYLMRQARTTAGAVKRQHLYLDSTVVKPLYNTVEQRTFNSYQYSLAVSRSARVAWTTVNDSEHGTTGMSLTPIESDYPLMIQRWTGDAAETVFNLHRQLQTGGSSIVYVNDVKQSGGGVDYTLTGTTLTFTVAPASAARIVAVWEYPEADIS